MTRELRIPRTQSDLDQELIEQLQLLRLDCKQYDAGFEPAAKRIAVALRMLLHHQGQSKALLHQLDLLSGNFLDTAGPLKPNNAAPGFGLLVVDMSSQSGTYLPLIATGGDSRNERMIPIQDWWTEPVLKDLKGRCFSRKDLVTHVADTDGGAHVDPCLSETYMALSRQNSIGSTYRRGITSVPLEGKPELACMRQIAHEVLSTLHRMVSHFSAEASPVIPLPRLPVGQHDATIFYIEINSSN